MANDEEVKRAETDRRIAQVKFKQGLKKELPGAWSPVTPDSSAQFCALLDALLQQNTPENIQKCNEWIFKHLAVSKARLALLGEYLVSVSKSQVLDRKSKPTKALRNRLDLIYLISDVLHTDKFHRHTDGQEATIGRELKPLIDNLLELVATCIFEKGSLPERKLRALINFWIVNELLSIDDLKSIQERVSAGLATAQGGTPPQKRVYTLPEWFGDKNAPWHDLPASYMLHPMIKHPDRPIDASEISITSFDRRQPSDHVCSLLDKFFENIDLKYAPTGDNPTSETQKHNLWLDPMGQLVKQNKETGETETVCNGYGWSTKLCEDMLDLGYPERVLEMREEFEKELKKRKEQKLDNKHSNVAARSPSPETRRYSPPGSDYGQCRNRYSRRSSRSSYGSRDRSRSQDSEYYEGRHISPREEDRDRDRNHDERDQEPDQVRRPPSRPLDRGSNHSNTRWGETNPPPRTGYVNVAGNNYSGSNVTHSNYSNPNYDQGFLPFPPGTNNNPPVPAAPPAPPYQNQYAPPQLPPPLPFQVPVGPAGMSAQPNYNGPYNNAYGNMGGYHNNPQQFGNNGYGNSAGYGGPHRGGFQGGGTFNRGFHGGYDNRGRHSRGRGGGRW